MLALKQQLLDLQAQDRSYQIFGADRHQYQSNPVLAEALVPLERLLGSRMPGRYRDLLMQVGWGAGPYYGLFSPDQILLELGSLLQYYREETGIPIRLEAPFPYTWKDLQACRDKLSRGDLQSWITGSWPCSGCVPICHQGCTYWSVLVVNGELAGMVFDLDHSEDFTGLWLPARRPPGIVSNAFQPSELPPLAIPPAFNPWYSGWLQRAMLDLQDLGAMA